MNAEEYHAACEREVEAAEKVCGDGAPQSQLVGYLAGEVTRLRELLGKADNALKHHGGMQYTCTWLARDITAKAGGTRPVVIPEPKGADLHIRMALSCLEELEPEAMRRKQRIVRHFNEHTERESQLSAARVSLDLALAALNP